MKQAPVEEITVKQLSSDVGINPKNDRIRDEDLDQLAADALNDACYPGNPREAVKEQVIEMFRQLMESMIKKGKPDSSFKAVAAFLFSAVYGSVFQSDRSLSS